MWMFSVKNGQNSLTRSASGWQESTNPMVLSEPQMQHWRFIIMGRISGGESCQGKTSTALRNLSSIIWWKKERLLKTFFHERSPILYLRSPGINPGTLWSVRYCRIRSISSEDLWILRSSSLYLHSCRICSMLNF